MGKQFIAVAVLALVFGGLGSSALLTRAVAQSKHMSAVQQEKRLGPKPTPEWYWRWIHWRLHDRRSRLEPRLRPKAAPHRIPHWAWRRLHFFLLARDAGKHKSPSGSVHFDARAKKMGTLYSHETTYGDLSTLQHGQSPTIWDCICFMQNDISLVNDSTFGKAYDVNVPTGDANPWNWSASYDNGAAQLSKRRANDLGKWDYFSGAIKVNSWNGPISDLFFADLWSLGYQTAEGDQVGFRLSNGPNNAGPLQFSVAGNAGYVNSPNAYHVGTTNYEDEFMPVTFGQWEEFVIGVKWASDKTGEVQVYHRRPGGSWSKIYDKTNIDTWLYGTTTYGTFPQHPDPSSTVIDKIGLYFLEYGGESEHVQESGLTRSSDLATAKSTLP